MIVLHYTAMRSSSAALERLCAPEHEVSAHYLISETGGVFALVPEDQRAWHAGQGCWGDVTDINSRSIGIELANPGDAPFAAPQMRALEQLLAQVMARHRIVPQRVIAHSDMAPARKRDPGPRFDWRRLALQRLSVWPEPLKVPVPVDMDGFYAAAVAFGYDPTQPAAVILSALRLRFLPGASGPLTPQDMATITDLARRFPVDRAPVDA